MENNRLTGYPSIDKPWLKYYDCSDKVDIPKLSIYQMIKKNNANRLDKIAIDLRSSANGYKKGIEITYGKFFERIETVAKAYSYLGLKPDDILITILPNIPESRILIYGMNLLGVTVYPVSPFISVVQLSKVIEDCGSKNIVVFDKFFDKFESALSAKSFNSVLLVNGMESAPFALKLAQKIISHDVKRNLPNGNLLYWSDIEKFADKVKNDIEPYYDSEHIAVIVGTSGTTGTPKGVCLTDDNLNAIAIQHYLSGILDEEDVMLDALIQSIGYGISTMHYSTCYGDRVILIPELLTDKFPEVLCLTKPDHFTGGPVHFQYLVNSKEFINKELPTMKNLVSGGASLSKSLEKQLNNVDDDFSENGQKDDRIIVRQGFGCTENGGCGAYAKAGAYKFGGVGIPLPLDTFAIFEPNTDKELPYNTEGEICISGPTVMKCYLNNSAETANVLKTHSDGRVWLHLADLGKIDEDGQVYIIDRIKNIFMRTGFNVHPSKIAEFISSLPYISECAVLGVSDPKEQMVPAAYMVINPDCKEEKDSILKSVQKEYESNLSETDMPAHWYFVDSIPRNAGGKVDNRALEQQVAETK